MLSRSEGNCGLRPAVSAGHMPVGSDRSLLSLRTAARTILGNVGEPSRLKEFLLFYREYKDCLAASAFHFDVLELLRNDHTAYPILNSGGMTAV